VTLAQCAEKYIMYTRSLVVHYCQVVARHIAAAKICRQTYRDRSRHSYWG